MITTPDEYRDATFRACERNGLDDGDWNDRFRRAADREGLAISSTFEKSDVYPDGLPVWAPLPAPNSKNPWPYPAYFILKPASPS